MKEHNMKKKTNMPTSSGLGFSSVLCLLLITLKLTNHIDWEWWIVFVPLWGPIALIFACLIVYLIFAYIYLLIKRAQSKV